MFTEFGFSDGAVVKGFGGRPEEVSLPAKLDPVTRTHLDRATDSLAEEFVGIFSRETVARFMSESLDLLGQARFNLSLIHI